MLRSSLYIICSFLFLYGCQNQPSLRDKTPTPYANSTADYEKAQDAETLLKQGQAARLEWDNTGKPDAIKQAHLRLKQAYSLQPDNINIQYAYYTASVAMAASDYGLSSSDIHILYKQLHPTVKTVVPSPNRLDFINAKNKGEPQGVLESILFSSLKKTPTDPYLWSQYASIQHDNKRYHFAAAIAKRAHEIDSENPAYLFQISNTLNTLSDENNCAYDEQALIKRAVKYANHASKKAPDNSYYVHQVAKLYFKLGLVPLAYDRAKKTYAMQKNQWSARDLSSTAILMGKYSDAKDAAEYLVNDLQKKWGLLYLAQIAIGRNEWEKADTYMKQYNDTHPVDFYELLIRQWIKAIPNNDIDSIDSGNLSSQSDWGQRILNYLNTQSDDITTLLDSANSLCQRTEAHFYIALNAWRRGNNEQTKKHLRLATRQGTAPYLEHIMATVLLRVL